MENCRVATGMYFKISVGSRLRYFTAKNTRQEDVGIIQSFVKLLIWRLLVHASASKFAKRKAAFIINTSILFLAPVSAEDEADALRRQLLEQVCVTCATFILL